MLNLVEKPGRRPLLHFSGGQAAVTIGQPWGDEEAETRLVFVGVSGRLNDRSIPKALDP